MMVILLLWLGCMSFRPLSWGLSFNGELGKKYQIREDVVFVPFLGDFLSIVVFPALVGNFSCFRPLSWGLSFNCVCLTLGSSPTSFRPLSWGLSFNADNGDVMKRNTSRFRPLSWGLSFNE